MTKHSKTNMLSLCIGRKHWISNYFPNTLVEHLFKDNTQLKANGFESEQVKVSELLQYDMSSWSYDNQVLMRSKNVKT